MQNGNPLSPVLKILLVLSLVGALLIGGFAFWIWLDSRIRVNFAISQTYSAELLAKNCITCFMDSPTDFELKIRDNRSGETEKFHFSGIESSQAAFWLNPDKGTLLVETDWETHLIWLGTNRMETAESPDLHDFGPVVGFNSFSGLFPLQRPEEVGVRKGEADSYVPLHFFEFDRLDHFSLNGSLEMGLDEESLEDPEQVKKASIYSGKMPEELADSAFLSSLKPWGYVKTQIDSSNFAYLQAIFSAKTVDDSLVSYPECIPAYRDILIFRNAGRISGIAKLCFKCDLAHFTGANASTHGFGMHGEFMRLARILHPDTPLQKLQHPNR